MHAKNCTQFEVHFLKGIEGVNQLYYNDTIYFYHINRAQRKHLYIYIKNGEIEVRAPQKMSFKEIEKAVYEKRHWIVEKMRLQQSRSQNNYEEGGQFQILGKTYTLSIQPWDKKRIKIERNAEKKIVLFFPYGKIADEENIRKAIERLYREEANKILPPLFSQAERITGIKAFSWKIKKMSRSWGLCKRNGCISINWNLIRYTEDTILYVLIHELCHIKHFDHSKEFWNLVEYYLPEYKLQKKNLHSQ